MIGIEWALLVVMVVGLLFYYLGRYISDKAWRARIADVQKDKRSRDSRRQEQIEQDIAELEATREARLRGYAGVYSKDKDNV